MLEKYPAPEVPVAPVRPAPITTFVTPKFTPEEQDAKLNETRASRIAAMTDAEKAIALEKKNAAVAAAIERNRNTRSSSWGNDR